MKLIINETSFLIVIINILLKTKKNYLQGINFISSFATCTNLYDTRL